MKVKVWLKMIIIIQFYKELHRILNQHQNILVVGIVRRKKIRKEEWNWENQYIELKTMKRNQKVEKVVSKTSIRVLYTSNNKNKVKQTMETV